MRFEWDSRKAASNLKTHEISFEEAVTTFYDPLAATFADPEHSDEEDRFVTIGYSEKVDCLWSVMPIAAALFA